MIPLLFGSLMLLGGVLLTLGALRSPGTGIVWDAWMRRAEIADGLELAAAGNFAGRQHYAVRQTRRDLFGLDGMLAKRNKTVGQLAALVAKYGGPEVAIDISSGAGKKRWQSKVT